MLRTRYGTGVEEDLSTVQSHFIDESSRLFVNLNKEKKPELRAGAIEQVADILNPASGLVEIELDDED